MADAPIDCAEKIEEELSILRNIFISNKNIQKLLEALVAVVCEQVPDLEPFE